MLVPFQVKGEMNMEKVMIKLVDNWDWSLVSIIVVNYNPKISKYSELVDEIQDTIYDVKEKKPDYYTYDDIYDALTSKFECEIYETSDMSTVEY